MKAGKVGCAIAAVLSLTLPCIVAHVQAAEVRLSWKAPTTDADGTPLTDLAGYMLYYGQTSGSYPYALDIGNQTTYILPGLVSGQRYYFSVTAYDTSGNESDFSNEVSAIPTLELSPPPSPPLELVAAYSFNEGHGTTVADASGYGNDGTISGATWTSQGRFRKALRFDGLDNWVTIDDASSLDLTIGLTLEAWVYPTETLTGWSTVIEKEQPNGTVYYLHANSDRDQPAAGVFINGEQKLYGGERLPANTWTHLAATYDGTRQRLYVNGIQVASRVQTGLLMVSGGPLRIGGNSVWGEYFQGRIDEVRIYNRALTAGEIQADMNTPIDP